MKRTSILIFVLLLSSRANAAMLTLIPQDGILAAAAGETVGWGFTLTNTSDYLLVTGSQFCIGGAPPFCNRVPATAGTFTDFAGPQFLVAGPAPESATLTQMFDNATASGLGSFSISSAATAGTAVKGVIELTYDLFSVSPNSPGFDPVHDLISNGNFLTDSAEVDVITPVPIPPAVELLIAGLLAMVILARSTSRMPPSAQMGPQKPAGHLGAG